ISTSAVDISIHDTSPLFGTGAAAAAGAASWPKASSGSAASSTAPSAPSSFFMSNGIFIGFPLKRIFAGFAGADAVHLFEIEDEDLAVADLVGARGLDDRLDHALQRRGLDGDLDLHLGQEVHHVFSAAVELRVPLLPAEALDLGHGDALHADLGERVAHVVELEGFDDGGNEFHFASWEKRGRRGASRRSPRLELVDRFQRQRALVLLERAAV